MGRTISNKSEEPAVGNRQRVLSFHPRGRLPARGPPAGAEGDSSIRLQEPLPGRGIARTAQVLLARQLSWPSTWQWQRQRALIPAKLNALGNHSTRALATLMM